MLARRLSLLVLLTLAACGSPGAAAPKTAPGPVEVTVMTLAPMPVTLTRELPGRVSARRVAEVRARVSGIVEKRLFVEGSEVKEGQPLYRIEPGPYQATLQSARATLQRAQSGLAPAHDIAKRDEELLSNAGAVSVETAERSAATLRSVEAEIAAGRAAVRSAKINLDYTIVTAPVSGRIGRSIVTEGAYVQQSPATLMATIQQIDTVYVDVTQSTTELQRLRRELESDTLRPAGAATTVTLVLEDGSTYGEKGSLEFTDVTVETGTGSVLLRAVFPNPRGELLPGMFVRARIDQGEDPQAILVPQRAVTRDTRGQAWALVVGPDNKVERRKLVADRVVGDAWRVTSGLVAGEQVILDGLQKARPGAEVTTVPAPPEELPKGNIGTETPASTAAPSEPPKGDSAAVVADTAVAASETKAAATGAAAAGSSTTATAAKQ